MKQSLKSKILKYYKIQGSYIHKGTIETLAKSGYFGKPSKNAVGYLGETSGRKIRELVEEGELEHDKNREGWFRATKPIEYEYLKVVGMDKVIKRAIK